MKTLLEVAPGLSYPLATIIKRDMCMRQDQTCESLNPDSVKISPGRRPNREHILIKAVASQREMTVVVDIIMTGFLFMFYPNDSIPNLTNQ